jgi:cytochrome c oxidase subunit 4
MSRTRAPKSKARFLRRLVGGLVALQALLAIRRYRRAVHSSEAAPGREDPRMHSSQAKPEVKPLRTFAFAWLGLLVLLAFTVGSAFVNLGGTANTAINLLVSVIMMLLLMTLFMHESKARRLTQLVSAAGVLWVILMIGLSLADYLTRVHIPAPWS